MIINNFIIIIIIIIMNLNYYFGVFTIIITNY